ncbi:META domain-containing protein [Flavobacterium chungangense]|uniref:Heat-shock protein n=1 Tax=Flavobacterium chungangense TaxID=554283 RepID=A0A6V6Z2R7_9FLAO|nr:META domain-containing protein [Flavobacterium chungangense]CAD0006033.1 heat-shock protein [Flavobacterium chungangense]
MKKYLILLITISLVYSCKSVKTKNSNSNTTSENTSEEDSINHFKATGNEPFWELKIGMKKIVFTSLIQGKENLSFSSAKPIRAMGANIKSYKASNANSSITISIQHTDRQNSMSGAISPYKVSIEIKNNTEANYQKTEGCGKYITDYRLHDIWVLEELNGYKVFVADFQKEFPRIEIHAEENRFMGFGGCNSITGSLFFENDLLRFSSITSTLMACAENNKEDKFVKALQNSTTYSIKNNLLTLSNPSGKLLVFRKVD